MNGTYFIALLGLVVLLLAAIVVLAQANRRKLAKLQKTAATDPITGGLNETGLRMSVQKQLQGQELQYTVVAMDVRNYRTIHQTFGGSDAARVLVHLHKVLQGHLSAAEPFARVNGDTFILLLRNRQEDEIRARLSRIHESANRFNRDRQDPFQLNLCFGICIPQDSTEPLHDMQERAVQMLEHPGTEPRFRFYAPANREPLSRKREMIAEVERALERGEFQIYLQPKVRLGDSRIAGAEALVRWRHPERGLLSPGMFVPLLEEYHMIHRLDLNVFESVCRKLADWKQRGWDPCPISVNLSRESLEVDLLEPFTQCCKQYGIDPELIEFELSENILLESPEKVRAVIEAFHSRGFLCALDDFGKNFIPLDLLRELEVDAIKLDRSFFFGENNNRRNRYIIEAILKLAAQMQIRTVAEGIDNESQVQYLKQAACDMIQGFCYFRPMAVEEFEKAVYRDGILRTVVDEGAHAGRQPVRTSSTGSIIMFSYLLGEDRVTFSENFSPALEGQLELTNAASLFRSSALIHENDRNDFFHLFERCHKEGGWVQNTLRFYAAEGRYEWLEVHLHEEPGASAGESVISGTLVNMAGWKNEVDRWKEKANRDALTGLYNREYFEHSSAASLEKETVTSAAIVFIDVDDFKHVNDTLGHMFGDDVLCCVAKRVLGCFRHTDIVARYGGDEFVVFVNGISRMDLEKRLQQLCNMFRYPYRNEEISYKISGSLGAAMFPEDGRTYQELLDRADSALYAAKERGKDQFVLYTPELEGLSTRK
ncbi:MAG: EAL domain-containing protein [Butyricicoccus sp.]|nr:EAL domain-containing protein [Butyricicoccus sp.]